MQDGASKTLNFISIDFFNTVQQFFVLLLNIYLLYKVW